MMNRQQRRALRKQAEKINQPKPAERMEDLSTNQLVIAINSSLMELERRGVDICDLDHPERMLYRIQTKHAKLYFLAAPKLEEGDEPDE